MEEKELKIEAPQGYEIDKEKSTFEKIVFKKISNRPGTWEDYCKLNYLKNGFTAVYDNCSTECSHTGSYDEFDTKERTEQFIALGKLLQLRDYWVQDYKFEDDAIGLAVYKEGVITHECDTNDFALTFPTREMANEFIDCFKDLLYDAKPLI